MPVFGTSHTPFVATATSLGFDGDVPATGSTAADAVALTPSYSGRTGASTAISLVDDAIDAVSSLRAELGAINNRFEHTIARLVLGTETTTASMARILDADMAEEACG